MPWAEVKEHKFDNLIALCPTCHARYDQKKEIDRKSMHLYKQNLAVLNGRYSDFERRLFERLANSNQDYILVPSGMDVLVANAVLDGFLKPAGVNFGSYDLKRSDGVKISFPMNHTFEVTQKGKEFVRKFKTGEDLG